jgi:adenylate cyclase
VPYLLEHSYTTNPEIHELRLGSNTIGRELDNNIIIMHKSLSRHHAEIIVTPNRVIIKDLGSLNHTFVNDTQIEEIELKDGDVVRCGNVVYRYRENIGHAFPMTITKGGKNISIITHLNPEQTRFQLDSFLQDSPSEQGTILKIKGQGQQQRTVDKLQILLEVSKQLACLEDHQQLLDKILELIFKIMSVDRGIILLANNETKELEPKARKYRGDFNYKKDFYSSTITNFVYEKGEAIITADAGQEFPESFSIITQEISASMCVPLKPKDLVIGVLYVDNISNCTPYSQEDLEFLTGLANQAAIALENIQLNRKIKEEAVMRTKLERFFPQSVMKKIKESSHLEIVETEVTILFADISNYTQMSSRMQPRQVIEMLNEYFTVMVEEIIFPLEGTLDKYMGDGLLAFWGAPYPHEDDADRAVLAAIQMQQAVIKLNQKWKSTRNLEIAIHIGLNTGRVAAGNIGSQQLIQYTTIGDTTNVSSRICSAAKAGEILISKRTLEKLKNKGFSVEKMPLTTVKGKDEPLELYKVFWQ